jgi:ABC-type lipoprotein release transport system permease subunit
MRLTFLVEIGWLILLRSWRTTLVLSFMLVVAVASLVFLSALAVGTNDAMIRNSTGLFSGHISGKMLRGEEIAGLQGEGVARVLVRRQQQVVLAGNDASVPLLLIGIEPAEERAATAFWQKIVAGRYPEAGEEAILLGEAAAKRLGLAVGDRLALGQGRGAPEKSVPLAGIYRTGITQLDQGLAFCPVQAMPAGGERSCCCRFPQGRCVGGSGCRPLSTGRARRRFCRMA